MTSGGVLGTSGWERRAFWRAWLVGAALLASVCTVNIFTVLHDWAQNGRHLPAWEPMVWEYTSGVSNLLLLIIPWRVLRLAPPGPGRWLRFVPIHLLASLVFSLLHVSLFQLLRGLIYALVGGHYDVSLRDFPYEYRKDIIDYALAVTAFWLALRLNAPGAAAAGTDGPATFDIRDGARIIRARVEDIAAVVSAGNYVEFILADGRRPLMRSTLAATEAALSAHGFVRTHRSWLVNPARVAGLVSEGSGDFRIELDVGAEAPLSRRFPEALARLKG